MSPVPVAPDQRIAALARLVGKPGMSRVANEAAAKRVLKTAPELGFDLNLLFATIEPGRGLSRARVRQACLGVPGAGRTLMLFLSWPDASGRSGNEREQQIEQAACVDAVCEAAKERLGDGVHLVQALPEPDERWMIGALERAGFMRVGDLAYLRRPTQPIPGDEFTWPEGVRVIDASQLGEHALGEDDLLAMLDRTYVGTADCPELCGLRDTSDVMASHRSVGRVDPTLWTIALLDGVPHGCVLLNASPEQRSVELVYLGISPALRGRGMGHTLLAHALSRLGHVPADEVTCAVDQRNTPALRVYERAGFERFGLRVAMVRSLRG